MYKTCVSRRMTMIDHWKRSVRTVRLFGWCVLLGGRRAHGKNVEAHGTSVNNIERARKRERLRFPAKDDVFFVEINNSYGRAQCVDAKSTSDECKAYMDKT